MFTFCQRVANVCPLQLALLLLFFSVCLEALKGKKEAKVYHSTKLCSDFHNKRKYVLHYRNLQTYLRLGMKLTKVHRVISFKQSRYLKKYIDLVTAKRAAANSSFKKRLMKLMANSGEN